MIRARQFAAPVLGLACLLASAAAPAASIDFTNRTPWGSADNQASFTSGFTTLTAGATSGSTAPVLRFNAPGTCTGAVPALACNGDGIGIYAPTSILGSPVDLSTEIDRVGRTETLTVTFANALHITSIEVLNLFSLSIPGTNLALAEQFRVSVNGGAFGAPVGSPTTSSGSGYFLLPFDVDGVTSLAFQPSSATVSAGLVSLVSDFTLARINYLPEPGAIGLFAAGALGLAAARRRRRA